MTEIESHSLSLDLGPDALKLPSSYSIFAETNSDQRRYIFQVTKDILTEMLHGHRSSDNPDECAGFVDKEIGTLTESNYNRV
jgi:hypothetical protein